MKPFLEDISKVIGEIKFLSPDEMPIALAAPNKDELFVAGYYDYLAGHVMLFRGNGMSLVVPASVFESNSNCSPDFNLLQLIDCGQTIKLGDYEASNRSILKAMDPDYLKKSEANEIRIRERKKVSN